MAVTIPSDLVVDVMRAADPGKARLAAANLKGISPPEAGTMFTDALQSLGGPRPSGDLVADVLRSAEPTAARDAALRLSRLSAEPNDAYAQFEAFMLRDAIEEMLPDSKSGAFGEGFSGGVWRSMAAEQFASIFTRHGGLGIAEMMREKGATPDPGAISGQWPYYDAPLISAYVPPAA